MVFASGSPPAVQDVTQMVASLVDTVGYLEASLRALQEVRSSLTTDPQGRLRILLDNITANLTLATVTTVGTVNGVTAVTDVTRINNFGTSTFNTASVLIPWNLMNIEASRLRDGMTTT